VASQLLTTKLYIPPARAGLVPRPRLLQRLDEGLAAGHKLTLISAPAGAGKTTLVSAWAAGCGRPAAWLSLDEGDNDPLRFLIYLTAALQTVAGPVGEGLWGLLQSPQPPPLEALLTALLNETAALPEPMLLVLDDYHCLDSNAVDQAVSFLLEHLPPSLHLVIATREDPQLPLHRLRARGQLSEVRAADLSFTLPEADGFLTQVMGLKLSAQDVAALETRTEGWIAGLQLAALSMQGQPDPAAFIRSFTGSHHFVLDYLVEEVLQQQPEGVLDFLLRTSVLERLCGPLCEAVLGAPSGTGQQTLEMLEHANLFLVPLDNERHWYRYHHLFAELLRKRLQQKAAAQPGPDWDPAALHIRASQWFEANGLGLEAFKQAAAAPDYERAERLIGQNGLPLHLRPTINTILEWISGLPPGVLETRPYLRVKFAALSLVAGQRHGVEEQLLAAETAVRDHPLDAWTRNLLGEIAAARSTLALTRYQPENILLQAKRALEFLPPENLTFRFTAVWGMAVAYMLRGERAEAGQAYAEALAISQASGDVFSTILSVSGLAEVQEMNNQLYLAEQNFRQLLPLFGEHPQPNTCEIYLGLARIAYEWNDLAAAEQYGVLSLELARQYEKAIDRFILSEVFLARLKLAQGDLSGAADILEQAERSAQQQQFEQRLPEIAAMRVRVLLRQGNLAAAGSLAEAYALPLCQARVRLAQGDPAAALAVLAPVHQQMSALGWCDEQLKVLVLQAVALYQDGQTGPAVQTLREALDMAKTGGLRRIFLDEGAPMAQLLAEAAAQGSLPEEGTRLLALFKAEPSGKTNFQPLVEPLSGRELEILGLVAQGFSNQAISQRLFLAVDTVKGHNRRIFEKLQVQNRTEAVARARELGIL
jgi:LuxR family maltose regulon positive regulatory protein